MEKKSEMFTKLWAWKWDKYQSQFQQEALNRTFKCGKYKLGIDLVEQPERKNMRKKDIIDKIQDLEQANKRLEHQIKEAQNIVTSQLKCAIKGHEFVFDKEKTPPTNNPTFTAYQCYIDSNSSLWSLYDSAPPYQFKCSKCGLTITKTKEELTVKENNALKTLGILKG